MVGFASGRHGKSQRRTVIDPAGTPRILCFGRAGGNSLDRVIRGSARRLAVPPVIHGIVGDVRRFCRALNLEPGTRDDGCRLVPSSKFQVQTGGPSREVGDRLIPAKALTCRDACRPTCLKSAIWGLGDKWATARSVYCWKPMKKLNVCRWSVGSKLMGKAKSKAIGAGPMPGTLIRRPKPGATR